MTGGYRKCPTFQSALLSLFYWHNESMNMWLHYIGSFLMIRKVFFAMEQMEKDRLLVNSSNSPSWMIIILGICFFFGNCIPFIGSALCHHFYCINQVIHQRCWFLDFTGLQIGVVAITIAHYLIVFQCELLLFNCFACLTIMVGCIFVYRCYCINYSRLLLQSTLIPSDRFPEFGDNMTIISVSCFVISIVSTISYYPQLYLHQAIYQQKIYEICLYPILLTCSIIIFAKGGIPERWTNQLGLTEGYFDYIGHSHQWWHIASWIILYCWIDVTSDHFRLRLNESCPSISA
jgi:predicted membrane channel-forming protein YqfA (hemolysin III family)